jgi:hypothetical protein
MTDNELLKNRSEQKKLKNAIIKSEYQKGQSVYLPPDEDNYAHHGINNLVLKYNEFDSCLKLYESLH